VKLFGTDRRTRVALDDALTHAIDAEMDDMVNVLNDDEIADAVHVALMALT
jgi:hypothetical protein